MRNKRQLTVSAIAYVPVCEWFPVQQFNTPVRYLTAIIKSFVNDQSLFIPLSIELPYQFILPIDARIRNIYVTNFPTGCFVNFLPVILDPCKITKACFS